MCMNICSRCLVVTENTYLYTVEQNQRTKIRLKALLMVTSKVEYLGHLRTECTHLASGMKIITDAPVDNHGKGEAFSPTDLVATAYASCMITIMGIYCDAHGISFTHAETEVEKVMSSSPRRIQQLIMRIDVTGNKWDAATADKVIRAGKACPVAQTLGDGVHVDIEIKW